MPFDPDFIPGFTIPLPELGARIAGAAFNGGTPIDHARFSLVFNHERGFAIYGAHNIDGATLIPEGDIPRHDHFRLDPDVPRSLQVDNDRGYWKNPWDRGHLVRRRSLHWGDHDEAEQADDESFFWTNITPQHHRLHATAWGKIEDWMLEWTDEVDRQAAIFTGPVLTPDDPERVNRSGEEPIQIPAGFWKVMAIVSAGSLHAAGFLVWQRDFDKSVPVQFDPVLEQVRITTLEYLTGLSFGDLRDVDPLHMGVVAVRALPTPGPAAAPAPREVPSLRRATVINGPEDLFLPTARRRR